MNRILPPRPLGEWPENVGAALSGLADAWGCRYGAPSSGSRIWILQATGELPGRASGRGGFSNVSPKPDNEPIVVARRKLSNRKSVFSIVSGPAAGRGARGYAAPPRAAGCRRAREPAKGRQPNPDG